METDGVVLRLSLDEALVLWHFGSTLAGTSNPHIDHIAEQKVLLRVYRELSAAFGNDPDWTLPDGLAKRLPDAQARVDAALDDAGVAAEPGAAADGGGM